MTSSLDAPDDVLAYERRRGNERLLVALNLCGAPRELRLPSWAERGGVLLSTLAGDDAPRSESIRLRANEGVVLAPATVA